MYQVGDEILYGSNGACIIQEISVIRFGRTREKYYVLRPKFQNTSVIYVPYENSILLSRMRPMLSREEADRLIDDIPNIKVNWIDDPQIRKATFEDMIKNGDTKSRIVIIRMLLEHRARRQADGKNLHVADDNFLRDAQRLLFDELATPLQVSPSEVLNYIKTRLGEV